MESQYLALVIRDSAQTQTALTSTESSCSPTSTPADCLGGLESAEMTYQAFLQDLASILVPARYSAINTSLVNGLELGKSGISDEIQGLESSNQSTMQSGTNLLQKSGLLVTQASQELQAAH